MTNEFGYIPTSPDQSSFNNSGIFNLQDIYELDKDDKWTQFGQLDLIQTQSFSSVSTVGFADLQITKYDVFFLTYNFHSGSHDVGIFGNFYLTSREDSLSFSILGYSQNVAKTLEDSFTISQNGEFNEITSHSPIIGWAYDGNPIYGPFGYSDADNINSDL